MSFFGHLKRLIQSITYKWQKNPCVLCILLVFILAAVVIIIYQSNVNKNLLDSLNDKSNTIAEEKIATKINEVIPKKNFKQTINDMQKLIHFDLKGSPPKLEYFKNVIQYLHRCGATGILIEYEDMFPYENSLERVKNGNAYTKDELNELLKYVKELGMIVIPLIQTYGHLEFVLKLREFKYLREIEKHFQVITPCIQDTYDKVLYPMIDQIIDFHKKYDLKYIHIGCDEVYFIALNPRCTVKQKHVVFVEHLTKLVKRIKEKESNLKIIMWDDVLRGMSSSTYSRIAKLDVELMVWNYETYMAVNDEVWDSYAKIFRSIWVASAFKGATSHLSLLPNTKKHYENHILWLKLIEKMHSKINFNGIALTGWSRYDHMQGICEVLPTGIPSAVLCLQTIINYEQKDQIISKTNELTKCFLPGSTIQIGQLPENAKNCRFPGSDVYATILEFINFKNEFQSGHDSFSMNLPDYALANGHVSSIGFEAILPFYPQKKIEINELIRKISEMLDKYFYSDLSKEFVKLYMEQTFNTIDNMNNKLQSFNFKDFKPRPYAN